MQRPRWNDSDKTVERGDVDQTTSPAGALLDLSRPRTLIIVDTDAPAPRGPVIDEWRDYRER